MNGKFLRARDIEALALGMPSGPLAICLPDRLPDRATERPSEPESRGDAIVAWAAIVIALTAVGVTVLACLST